MTPATHEVTMLLKDWGAGDESALDKLMPLVHDELHRLARQHDGVRPARLALFTSLRLRRPAGFPVRGATQFLRGFG